MALTDPYRSDAEMFLRDSVQHVHKITVYRPGQNPVNDGVVLDLVTATVTIDEDATPRFTFNGAVGLVEDQAFLDLLDPRKGTRLRVEVGYRYADRKTEIAPLCDLVLTERVVRRPQNDITLVAQSDERIVMDQVAASYFPVGTSKTRAVYQLMSQGHSQPVNVLASGLMGTLVEELRVEYGGTWDALRSLIDNASAEAYHDGLTGFFVRPQAVHSGASKATLATGRSGTITASEAAIDREGFANYIVVIFSWRDDDGTDQTVRGIAEQVDGPYGTTTVGRVGLVHEVERRGSAGEAYGQALGILYRTLSRGRRLHVEDSAARYWLRPGDGITVRLPTGNAERPIVSRVTFNLPQGSMSIHTRQPEYVSAVPPA
ncbi:hypothetical protein [Cellulosimicrobium sp. SL-1]|uniref:hypothetical protein n=1 Tax=Cellulosimicrobium sp. SL-1 TaxID=2699423 RepID=UPI0013D747F8|nr:hypothetical protein [Cellulosimicrobium sp. SL-1]